MIEVKKFFKINDSFKPAIISIIIAFVIVLVSYNSLIVYGFGSPDGVIEGYHYYNNTSWIIGGCGRWFLALINNLHANLVLPWLICIECFIVNWLCSHTTCKLLKINNIISYIICCALFVVIPPFIVINTVVHSSFPFHISVLFSALCVYFNNKDNISYCILSSILFGCAMGCYQSQIGIVFGLSFIVIINRIIDGKPFKKFLINTVISCIGALLVYIVGLFMSLNIYNLTLYDRAASFSISSLIINFPYSFIKTYNVFFNTFNQMILKRKYVYIVIFIIFIYEIITLIIKIIKNKEYKKIICTPIIFLLPLAFNIVGIILPNNGFSELMLVPNYLFIFFVVSLLNYIDLYINKYCILLCTICIISLCWTYILSANATYTSYQLSYNVYYSQISSALNRVYNLDGYKHNETRIIIIGHPADDSIKNNMQVYNYAISLSENLLYWDNTSVDQLSSYHYILDEFGVDIKPMQNEDYEYYVYKKECLEMPCWPNKDSVQMIDGNAIIKFSNY